MGPNDAQIICTFVTKPNGGKLEYDTLRVGDPPNCEIVVETAFGNAFSGTASQIGATIIDQTTSTVAANYGPYNWSAVAGPFTHTFPIAAAALAGRAHHVCQVIAYLQVGIGANEPDASFAEDTFLVVP